MEKDKNVTFNISGGQVNVANGHAIINATQNNGIKVQEIDKIISAIKSNLSGLAAEDAETIIDSVDMIREEINKSEPKGKIIGNGIKLIAPLITILNGTPVLIDNLKNFISIVSQYVN